jgi:hypothetical protein
VDVSADGEGVVVEARRDGQRPLERRFLAARRTETDLIGETIESVGRDPIAAAAIRCAAALAGGRRGS